MTNGYKMIISELLFIFSHQRYNHSHRAVTYLLLRKCTLALDLLYGTGEYYMVKWTVKGARRRGRQKKRWEDNIQE